MNLSISETKIQILATQESWDRMDDSALEKIGDTVEALEDTFAELIVNAINENCEGYTAKSIFGEMFTVTIQVN